MARPLSGTEALAAAQAQIKTAKTVDELRAAQAVFFPLALGLSLKDTAAGLGVTRGWVCTLRRRFIADYAKPKTEKTARPRRGSGKGRSYMTKAEEQKFLLPFVDAAAATGILDVKKISLALEKKLGRRLASATTYNLLHRHQWRKTAPNTSHARSGLTAHEEWKKTFMAQYNAEMKLAQPKRRAAKPS